MWSLPLSPIPGRSARRSAGRWPPACATGSMWARLRMRWQRAMPALTPPAAAPLPTIPSEADAAAPPARAVARTYPYAGDAACDAHVDTFLAAIASAAAAPGAGFAAVKVTALGDPRLLVRASASLRAISDLFSRFDVDADGRVSRAEFGRVYAELFSDATSARVDDLFAYLDADRTGRARAGGGRGSGLGVAASAVVGRAGGWQGVDGRLPAPPGWHWVDGRLPAPPPPPPTPTPPPPSPPQLGRLPVLVPAGEAAGRAVGRPLLPRARPPHRHRPDGGRAGRV